MIGVRRALLLSTGERYVAIAINFVTIATVSRILTPGEIGVSVIGMAVVGMAMSAREFASANYLIQQQGLTRETIRAAFGVMLLMTALITVVLAAGAPLIAAALDDPRLIPYLRVISASLFIELVALPIVALLRRDMAFGKVMIINTSGAAIAAAVSITLALLGFSYMSFAWAWLSSAVVTAVLALALGRQVWIFRPLFRGWRGMLAFGGYNGATNLFYRIYESLPYLLLGRILSVDAAALYNRSLMICQLPDKIFLGGAMSVVLPAFSREVRDGRDLRPPYLKALGLITVLQWPALVMLALLAYPVVDLVLGDQWQAVAPLVQIMALALLFSFSFELNYPVLVAVGAVRDAFYRALIVCPVSAGAITVAAFFGLTAVACSLLLVIPFQALVSLSFIRRHICIAWSEIGLAVWRSAAVTGSTVAGPVLFVLLSGSGFALPLHAAVVAGVLAAVGWICGLWLTDHEMLGELRWAMGDVRGRLLAGRAVGAGGSA
jgi:O-antigen/teichoic acid export membrane protein